MTATTLHELHYTTTTTPLRYNYNYSCSTSHYIQQLWVRWPLQPLQPFQQTQLQPPFGQSVASLCHPWFTTTNVSYRFPIFETSATALCGTTGKYVKVLYFFLVDIPFFRFSWLKLLHFLVNQPISMVEHPRELNPGHFDWSSTNHFGFVSCEKPKSGHQFYVTFWKRS